MRQYGEELDIASALAGRLQEGCSAEEIEIALSETLREGILAGKRLTIKDVGTLVPLTSPHEGSPNRGRHNIVSFVADTALLESVVTEFTRRELEEPLPRRDPSQAAYFTEAQGNARALYGGA